MTIPFDPAGDFARVTDGLMPVIVQRPGAAAALCVDHALCRAIRTREAEPSGGHYTAANVIWYLPAAELPGGITPADILIDQSARRWTVLDVQSTALRTCWRCVCRVLSITEELDQQIAIEKAEYHKSPGGAEQPVWHTWRAAVRAHIQPIAAASTHEADRDATAARFIIYCRENLSLDHTHRIRGPDGALYRILACRKSDRIDALTEIDVTRL